MRAAHEARRAKMKERRGEARGGRHARRGGMAMLLRADTNGDKAVSRAEFDAAVEARFAKVDTDGSGSITAEERAAAHAAMKERREQRKQRQ